MPLFVTNALTLWMLLAMDKFTSMNACECQEWSMAHYIWTMIMIPRCLVVLP